MARALQSPLWYRIAAIKPRLRPHVRITRQVFRDEVWYVVEDTAHNRFHRFPPAGHAAIALMDGSWTVDEIWGHLSELGENRPTQYEMIQLLAQLDTADLLASDQRPDFGQLAYRSRRLDRQKMTRRLLSPLYIRVPLVDPDRFLTVCAPYVRPFWSIWGLLLWFAVVGWGVAHAALNWTALTRGLADRVLAADNLLILALTFPALKLLHECGHGFATKLGGGEVHEAGVMTLITLPVPYIDVSSSTAFRSRWQRALVGAAGMLVETFVAGLAMMVWVSAEPGLLRAAAFNVMVIAGVSTLIFNGNPLLRFDAYYILSDLIEVPNLATRATRFYGYLINRYIFSVPDLDSPADDRGEAAWFLVYAPAAYVYRLMVMVSIALFVASALHGVGVVLAVWTLAVGIAMPILRGAWFLLASPTLRAYRLRALGITGACLAATVILLFAVKLPYATVTEGVIWAPPEAELRAGAEGTVDVLAAVPGAMVQRGAPVLAMRDPLLEARVHVLEAQLNEVQLRLFAAEDRDKVQAQSFQQQVGYFTSELTEARRRRASLVVNSPTSGQLLLAMPQDLPGRFLRRGELFGYVVDGKAASIRVVVSQTDIELVRQDTRAVSIRLASNPLVQYRTPAITREIPTATRELPSPALSVFGGGEISVDPADEKHVKAVEMLFQIDLALPEGVSVERLGERVYVRLDHGSRTLGWRIGRAVRQSFLRRFEL
jgi:putative peptide zinc metalloprotease protein